MQESPDDLQDLQEILDRSYREAGGHLRATFTEDSRLSARELVGSLTGIFEMHLAVTTAGGAPLVAPVDAILYRGRVWFGLPRDSVRSKRVRRDPRVSASYTRGKSFAVIIHGAAIEVSVGSVDYSAYSDHLHALYVLLHGPGWNSWYERHRRNIEDGYHGWIEPRQMFAKR